MNKEVSTKFNMTDRWKSIRYATSGVLSFFRAEHNAKLHLVATGLVVLLGIILKINRTESAVLSLAIGLVWAAELFNTAIEAVMDHLSPQMHPAVKKIKDLAAGAVLLAALAALVSGCFIFLPKVM